MEGIEERVCIDCGEEFKFKNGKTPEKCPSCNEYFSLFRKTDLLSNTYSSTIIIEELPRQDLLQPA